MTERKQLLSNRGDNHRSLRECDRYPDELIECATVRPEKYHILKQKEYDDCIITSYHKIINSEYLDVERELINEKLLNSGKSDNSCYDDFQYGKEKTGLYGGNVADESQCSSNVINSDTGIIFDGKRSEIVDYSEQESSEGLANEYSDDELDAEYDKLGENLDEEDEESNGELLLLLKSREGRRRSRMRDVLNLPNSDYLILRNLPVSFGIPIISVKKLNVRSILLLWFVVSLLVIYGTSLFLNEYIINDIIPLYDMDNVIFRESSKSNGKTGSKAVISSFLRSNRQSTPSFSSNNILKRLFPSFVQKGQTKYGGSAGGDGSSELSVNLDLKNCHVQFLDSKSELSYIKIRSWRVFSESQLYYGSVGRYRISRIARDKYEYMCSHNTFTWTLRKYLLPFSWSKHVNMTWREHKEYCDGSLRPWNYVNDSNLHIKLHQSNTGDYFQCSVNFFLSEKFKFNELSIKYIPSSNYMRVASSVPIYTQKLFHLEALHGIFDLRDIHSQNISISLSDGWSSIDIPSKETGDEGNANVLIESRGASVYINSRVPLMVVMPIRVAELSVLRSRYVKVELDKKNSDLGHLNYYKLGSVIAKLNANRPFYGGNGQSYKTRVNIQGTLPPVYINVNDEYDSKSSESVDGLRNNPVDEELETWVGKYQLMDPHLFLFSKSRFENFNKWLQEDLSSPWVLYINILGNSEYPKGTWKAVSSRAFIRDAYGLVLISGGLLKPRTYNLYIHILGLKCLSPIDHSDLEDLDVINVDSVGKDAALNELYASELGNGGSVDALDTGFDNFTGGMSVSASKGVVLNKKSENRGILGNITSRLSGIMGTGNDTKSGKPRFVDLREMFGGKYGTRMLSNNIQEAFYFGGVDRDGVNSRGSRSTGGNLSELLASYASSENSVETRISSINQVGSYIGRSSSIKSCESSITESIFSVINSEIAETIQQPSVIVWTQNENTNGTKPSDLESKKERNSVKALINNNIMKIFKSVYSFLYTVENILFPSWLIPGWSDLSKKIAKSSILAEDDYNNFDLGVLTESDHVYNNNKSQFIYTAENDAILRDLVTANDLQGYIVSLVLNIVCAVFVAAFSMWVLYYYVFPWFLTGIRELQLVSTASHRLNHDFRTSETGEWIVMVFVVQWPEFGLLLRWNQRQRLDGEKICIYIKQVEMNSSSGDLAEFFLYIPANEASLTTHFGRNQQELFVPMKYSDKCVFEVTMPYELVSDNKYRLRILRISSFGHIIEQSNWSNEIIPGDKMRFVDFPLLFLRRFLPIRRSSLNLFIDKNTDHYSPFGIPFYFKNIEIVIFDALDGKRKKRNSFSFEYFDDSHMNEDKDGEVEADDSAFNEGNVVNIEGESNQVSTSTNDYISCGELKGRRKYLLVARLAKDFEHNSGSVNNEYSVGNNSRGMSGVVNGDSASSEFNITSISNDDDSIASLRSYIFKNKSFDSDKVRIEGSLENINKDNRRLNLGNMNDFNSCNNVFILGNRKSGGAELGEKGSNDNRETSEEEDYFDENNSLYLEQSLISQKRILFELQEADSGQIIANGDIKCSKLVEIAWKSLTSRDGDDENWDFGVSYGRRTPDTDIIQVHDTTSNRTISIHKFVNVSINLYYVEGGQWGELSMSLDRSFWVQYLRHDLSKDIIIDLSEIGVLKRGEKAEGGIEMTKVANKDVSDAEVRNNGSIETESDIIEPRFVNDTPGKIVINGSDTQINWEWRVNATDNGSSGTNANYVPKRIHLHLFDHCTDTFLTSLHSDITVPNNGTYAWSVDIPFISQRSPSRDVYLVMSVSVDEIPSNMKIRGRMMASRQFRCKRSNGVNHTSSEGDLSRANTKNASECIGGSSRSSVFNKQVIVAVSNSFKVIRLTTLSEFEMLYATFCRTFGLEMEVVTYNDLLKYGFHVSKNNLRICENIRRPVPSETNQGGTYCPGQYIISSKALAVRIGDNYDLNKSDKDVENYMFLKSQRKYIDVIENCTLNYSTYWWLSSPDRFLLKNGIILDTSIFLPLTIRIITLFKIDLMMLYMRNLSIKGVVSRFKRRLLVFNGCDSGSSQDLYLGEGDFGGGCRRTINISSGLLVHSNYSTVYRRRSTWRSGKLNSWRIILSFINLRDRKSTKNGNLDYIAGSENYKNPDNFNGETSDNGRLTSKISRELKSVNKSKRRWSNALVSLRLAQLRNSPEKLFSDNGTSRGGYGAIGKGDDNCALDDHRDGGDSNGLLSGSTCRYLELTDSSCTEAGSGTGGDANLTERRRASTGNEGGCMLHGYSIGYGGILVPLYIANIKQRQEMIREMWYKLQFSTFPVVLKTVIYGFQLTLLSIFPITCIILTLLYNYLSTQTISRPHTYISAKYISDIVFNPRWDFFMSISFPVPHLMLVSFLHLLIINITFVSSNTSHSTKTSVVSTSGSPGTGRMSRLHHYWIRILVFLEDIGMFVTLFSTFLTLLAISMFFLWFLLGSLINSDNILPYVVMLLALGFVIVSLWNNFTSSRGIVDKFIAENLQSLISIALGHWFEATNQSYSILSGSAGSDGPDAPGSNGSLLFSDPNDLRSKVSDRLQCEILSNRRVWSKHILDQHKSASGSSNPGNSSSDRRCTEQDYADGSAELRHSTKMSKVHDLRSRSSSFSTLTDCCDMYSLRWEYMKISPARSKRLFKLSKNSEITGVDETMSIYYGMRLATKKDVLLNSGKVNGLLGELDVVLLRDGIKYGSKHGYKVRDFSEKDNNWYKFALVKIPIFPTGSALSDEAKVKLIFDFFDVDRDGYLNKKEMLQWIINLSYDERYFVNGENTKYGDIVEYINSTFSLNVDERNGFVIDDLVAIYSFSPGSVNADYEKIVPVSNYSSGSAEVGGGAHGVSPESNGLEGEKEPDAEDSGSGDGLVLAGNCLDEEEYDDEFGDRIFKLGGSAPDTGLEEGGTHSSLLDRRGYLWADLLSNEDNNIAYRAESRRGSRTTETRVVATDLNDLKLTRVGRTRPNRDVAVGGKGGPRAKGKHNKFQQLREVNVQKLKYIFTFATRNLKTPDIETALKDIHSLAYKVFEAQIALLIPIFGAKNVLSRGSSSGCLREEHVACVRNEVEEEFAGSGVVNADSKRASAPALGSRSLHQASSQLLSSFSSASFVNLGGAGGGLGDGGSYAKGSSNQNLASLLSFPGRSQRRQSSCAGSPGTDGANGGSGEREEDTVKFLQLMRILHNEIRQDIWLLFGHILGKLFNDNRVKNGANHFLDTMYPKLVRRKAARIVNIFYGPSLSELSASIHEYFASAPPKTAAQVVDALKEYRVENQRNVRDTLDIISQSQGNASVQFQVSLITKALYALSLLKDNDVEMLTVDIPWKKSRALIAEEVLILPKNRQGMKLILESIQIVLRRVNSITGANAGGGGVGALGDSASADGGESGAGRRQGRGGGTGSLDLLQSNLMDGRFAEEASDGAMANNEFTEATLEQVIQTIVSRYLWMDSFIFLIRLCGINLSTDRLPSVTYDNSASITNLNYVEERNLEHVKNVFTKLSNGSGFLPVELSDLAVQTLTDKCLNFSGLLVAMNFLGLISDNMFLLGSGNPAEKLSEMGLSGSNVVSVNRDSGAAGRDDGRLPEDLLPGGEAAALATEKTCNYGELLDWTLLSGIRGIPDDMVKDFRSIAMLRCGFIGRSQLHDYIRQHRKLYIAEAAARADAQQPAGRNCFEEMAREGGGGPADFNISFDIFDVALTTLGFSSHKLQSRVLWLLLCLNASLDGTQLFVSARLARDFVIMLYLRPRYKHGGGAGGRGEAETAGGAAGHDNVSGGVGTGQRLGSSYRSSMLDPSFQQCKDLDAQDVECYGGYFTYEMLRRFLVLAKISLPDNGVGAMWESLPKDPLDITDFMQPLKSAGSRGCDPAGGRGGGADLRREVRLTRKKSLGDIFRKRPVAATWSPDSLDGCGGEGGGAAELNGEGVGGGAQPQQQWLRGQPGDRGPEDGERAVLLEDIYGPDGDGPDGGGAGEHRHG